MSKANRQKRAEPRTAPSLEQAMERALEMTEITETGEEDRIPHLYLWRADGALVLCALAVEGGGAQFACAARLMVFKEEPVVAVVAVEGWSAQLPNTPEEEMDPFLRDWLERRKAGENLGVVDLPPDYRGETLNLIGEDQDGQMMDHIYTIRPRVGEQGKRRFERLELEHVQENRFHPLFILPWARRAGISDDLALMALRKEAGEVGLGPREWTR